MVSNARFALLESVTRKLRKRGTWQTDNIGSDHSSSDEESFTKKAWSVDPWHNSTIAAHSPDLSLYHSYGGSNFGRFQTSLDFIKPPPPFKSLDDEVESQVRFAVKFSFQEQGLKYAQSIGFLDLPKEIRLMVYECLTIRTRHDVIKKDYTYKVDKNTHCGQISCTLITKSVPGISILATCKMISDEAWPILLPLLNEVTYDSARILLDAGSAAETVASPASPLAAILGYYAALREQPLLAYRELLFQAEHAFDPWPNAVEAALINNGYYQDYPFHLYPWIFSDAKFRNAAKKLAHQLVSHDKSYSENFVRFEIAVTNKTGLSATEVERATELFHSALTRWFAGTRVKFYVQCVPESHSTSFHVGPTDSWTVGNGDYFSKIVWSGKINSDVWKTHWAEGERFPE